MLLSGTGIIISKDVIQKAGELGFCSLYTPEEQGGYGVIPFITDCP